MASFQETLRFCFPQPVPPSRQNGVNSRDRATETASGRQEPEDLGKGTKKLTLSAIVRAYALDWLLVIAMWCVQTLNMRTPTDSRGLLAVLNRSPGHKREFSLNDISIQHTFAVHERVPPK